MLSLPCAGHSLFLAFFLHCDLVSGSAQNQIAFFRPSDTLQRRPSAAAKALSKAQRLPSPPPSLSLFLSLRLSVCPAIGKSISLLAVQLFERLRPILADKTAASQRKKRKVSLSLGLKMMRWKSFHAEPNKRSDSWNLHGSSWLRLDFFSG